MVEIDNMLQVVIDQPLDDDLLEQQQQPIQPQEPPQPQQPHAQQEQILDQSIC